MSIDFDVIHCVIITRNELILIKASMDWKQTCGLHIYSHKMINHGHELDLYMYGSKEVGMIMYSSNANIIMLS